jgi:hypothetical protein
LQAGGRRFDSVHLHHFGVKVRRVAVAGGIQVSIACAAIPGKVCGVRGWMFASQAELSWSRNVLCQGE